MSMLSEIGTKQVKWVGELDTDEPTNTQCVAQEWYHQTRVPIDRPCYILVLAFKRSKSAPLFSKRYVHVEVETFLVPTPPPTLSDCGLPCKSHQFNKNEVIAVHIDTLTGVNNDFRHLEGVSSETHDVLCIPLTNSERDRVVDLIHTTRQCKYNAWDAVLSQTAPLFTQFVTLKNKFGNDVSKITGTITELHSAEFVTLMIQTCVDDTDNKNKMKGKMWGYNSRITTPSEIYNELHGVCMSLNPDALRSGYTQAWGSQKKRHTNASWVHSSMG
jgi:hypothetical protein